MYREEDCIESALIPGMTCSPAGLSVPVHTMSSGADDSRRLLCSPNS